MAGLGIFTGVNDGYDRHVVHNKEGEQIGAGQWSSEISWTPPRLLATNSGSGKSSREQERRRAGVGWALHRRSAGIAADLLGLRPGEYWPSISTTGRGAPVSGPVRSVSESRLSHFRPAIEPTTS